MNEFDELMMEGFETLREVSGDWRYVTTLTKTAVPVPRLIKVIWSTEGLDDIKMRGAFEGVYYNADALMTIKKVDLEGIPKPGLVISVSEDEKSMVGIKYRIIKITEDYGTFALALVRNT